MERGDNPEARDDESDLLAHEVRYSLPLLLRELQLERSSGHFAMEILDQIEISRMFELRRQRNAKRRKP